MRIMALNTGPTDADRVFTAYISRWLVRLTLSIAQQDGEFIEMGDTRDID
jgi:hypothetical protein